ncbi:UNVERIFIED_CONTAM: hypothetical protein HDU68_012137, partial [Siphonaria sp. JEL0065]
GTLLYYTPDTKIAVFLTFLRKSFSTVASSTRDVVDSLLVNEFAGSLTRDELVVIVLQVRYYLSGKNNVHALAFECVFGKFSYIYDIISDRLGKPFEMPLRPPREIMAESSSQTDLTSRSLKKQPQQSKATTTSSESAAKPTSKRTRTTSSSSSTSTSRRASSNNNREPTSTNQPKEEEEQVDPILSKLKNPFAVSAIRRASGIPAASTSTTLKRPASSSPPSAIKDISQWRHLLASEGENITLDECEPIMLIGGLFENGGTARGVGSASSAKTVVVGKSGRAGEGGSNKRRAVDSDDDHDMGEQDKEDEEENGDDEDDC